MAEVLFITPNVYGRAQDEPMGTLLLATILRNKGISAEILQFRDFGSPEDFDSFLAAAIALVAEYAPKIVSFYTRCDTYHIVLTIAQKIKEYNKDIYVVFGGPQADITAVDTIREMKCVDFVCCGEGETTVYPFFSSLLERSPNLKIEGLVYRSGEQIIQNPKPKMIEDLDSLPMVDYSLLRFSREQGGRLDRLFPVDVGRGCPFACTYCSTKTFWGRKYRLKSPERIVAEIRQIHKLFGISEFVFSHDMFTMNRARVIETCELLKKLDFSVSWRCSARTDCVDRELLDIMADSGMKSIFFGIETGSLRMQKLTNKRLKLDGVVQLLRYISDKGIKATTSFIYGFPEETEDDVNDTLELITRIADIGSVTVWTHLCTFLPGTELSERYKYEMMPTTTYSNITGDIAVEECADLITAHPSIFQHLMEYKTQMRAKLEHFSAFVEVWTSVRWVYRYLEEKYPRVIDMYYDFVHANKEVLEQVKDKRSQERINCILVDDRFVKSFEADENYDIIADIYRMKRTEMSDQIKNGENILDIYCFSPKSLVDCSDLREIERKNTVVSYVGIPGGGVKRIIHDRKK